MRYKNRQIAVIAIMMAFILVSGVFAMPNGATVNVGASSSRGFFASAEIMPLSGMTMNMNATTKTQTTAWQAFYGNVSGNITLDSNTSTMFVWTDAISGNVIATRNSNIDFSNISAVNNCIVDENMTGTGSDRVNKTFKASNNTMFTIGETTIAAGTACTAYTYVNNASQSSTFEEIIVTDGTSTMYVTEIEENKTGFDGKPHDFQILVPDNKNETTSTYYIYVEME